jgi:CTP:molybdopterin cytidylyltransferase MocA
MEMDRPVLVIMAAGMGSRYGGLKQIDPVDPQGNIIMDYSIYDAALAGFKKVIFVIKKENLQDFKEAIGDRVSQFIETEEREDIMNAFEQILDESGISQGRDDLMQIIEEKRNW